MSVEVVAGGEGVVEAEGVATEAAAAAEAAAAVAVVVVVVVVVVVMAAWLSMGVLRVVDGDMGPAKKDGRRRAGEER